MVRDSIITHVFPNPLPEAEPFSDLPPVGNEETSIDATVASFRWVLDNGEGTPLEDAYKDPWLHHLYDSESDGDGMSVDKSSSAGKVFTHNYRRSDKIAGFHSKRPDRRAMSI